MITKKAPDNEQLEIIMSITKYSGKIHKLTLYDKVINNPIHR